MTYSVTIVNSHNFLLSLSFPQEKQGNESLNVWSVLKEFHDAEAEFEQRPLGTRT